MRYTGGMTRHPERWQIQQACLSRHRDKGTYLDITARPLRAVVLQYIGDSLFFSPPEWTFRARWGKGDEDGWTPRSLGAKLYSLGQWAGCGFGTWKLERTVAEIPLSREQVLEHFPDVDPFFAGDSTDSYRGRPGDLDAP